MLGTSPLEPLRPACQGADPCTDAKAGSVAAATEVAPRLHRKDLRDNMELDWLLMRKLLRHSVGEIETAMGQKDKPTGANTRRLQERRRLQILGLEGAGGVAELQSA